MLTALPIDGFPEVQLRVRYATEHRCGIVLHGSGLTDSITGTDPLRDGCPLGIATPLDASPEVKSCGLGDTVLRVAIESGRQPTQLQL